MRKSINPLLTFATATVLLFSCTEEASNNTDMSKTIENHGIDLHYMDTTVNPKDDFYNYVNGTWMKETEIPADQSSWGSFYILRKNTDKVVLGLLDKAINDNQFEEGSDQSKAVYLFKSKLDTVRRDEAGLAPLKPVLAKIDAITDIKSLQKTMSENRVEVANPFFSIYASPKPEESSMNGAELYPGGLGLPDRDYYTSEEEKSKEVRGQYVDHIVRMFGFLGEAEDVARPKAERILALETKLAIPRMTKEERRDATKQNNPRSISQISKLTPAIDWNQWIAEFPVKKEVDTLLVTQLNYMKGLQEILTKEDINTIKELISWQTLNGAASELTTELEAANFDFYSRTLNGIPQPRPADERALQTVNGVIGEALGKIYVEDQFPAEAKETAKTMVENIMETYKERIKNLDWMTEETKVKAIEKVNTLIVKIGYPDVWKDYTEMGIKADNSYYENMVAASEWRLKYNYSKINEPVDKNEWFMSPQTVNAYYNPQGTEIVFPAAILQPPFFDYKADAAVNFGGIGAVIGHEISHAFDDQGANYDSEGNLKNWWTPEDKAQFDSRTKKLADFYSKIEVEDGLNLNGEFTLGENTADLGGVLSAYYGLQRYYETHEKPGDIDGLSQEQRLFMSWATVWRNKTRDEALRTQIKTDPHSPGYYRAFIPLQNIDEWYAAFGIEETDKMYVAPEDRVRIW